MKRPNDSSGGWGRRDGSQGSYVHWISTSGRLISVKTIIDKATGKERVTSKSLENAEASDGRVEPDDQRFFVKLLLPDD